MNFLRPMLTVALMFCTLLMCAQDFQGKAYYQSKTSFDMSGFGGREMSPEMKKRIQDRMNQYGNKNYVLTFDKSASTYKEEEQLESPGSGSGGWGRMMMGSFSPGKRYKNTKDQQLFEEREFMGKKFLIDDKLEKLDWKLEGETKVIGNYTCFKATAVKKVDAMDWRSMRRRNNDKKDGEKKDGEKKEGEEAKKPEGNQDPMSEIESPKTMIVTAWYTPQIPVSQGPADYWGLPGLILEVNADRTTILCSKIVLNPEEKEAIEAPEKGKKVTRKEYQEIIQKKMQEMRDMRGRGRRGGFHG